MADEGLAASLAATAANGMPWANQPQEPVAYDPVTGARLTPQYGAPTATPSTQGMTLPEKYLRQKFSQLGDLLTGPGRVMSGELPMQAVDPNTGEVHTSPQGLSLASGLAGLASTGGIAGTGSGGMALGAGPIRRAAANKAAQTVEGVPTMPQVAERYPETAPPVLAIDKDTGKEFMKKVNSPEAEQVRTLRLAAQKEIDKGNYTPYFDPAQRHDVDPSNYPDMASTLGQLAQRPKEANAARYQAAAGPEAAARLDAAYQRGLLQKEDAGNWYHMGQLENEFIKEYGPEEGRRQFKEKFADAMAATTGGASPKDNLMMAGYGNYLRTTGQELPPDSNLYPFPAGGRYAEGNMTQFKKMLMEGGGVTSANPKRYNFSGNFTGNPAGSTIDEQMMGLIDPGGLKSPPKGAYGQYEGPVAARAEAAGVDPRYYQEVAWAGAKDAKDAAKGGYKAQPMIGVVNEAIERTHRITGMPREEIVRRGLVRGEIPIYGLGATLGGLAAGRGAFREGQDEQRQ